jgi:hypothetical protein
MIGRNQPCPCGSGKKFKRCHGDIAQAPIALVKPDFNEVEMASILKKHELLEFQRERQQGRGKPIISTESDGTRFVAIGNRVAYGPWNTFPDFLLFHLKQQFGIEWGNAQMAKPPEAQHPLIRWLSLANKIVDEHATEEAGIKLTPGFGAIRAINRLAYDLYVIEHHIQTAEDQRAFERLMQRLRQPAQFLGARHEARVAGLLLRAGFDLSWEDEQQGQVGGHPEFVATFPQSGRAFWVECKMRQAQNDNGAPKFIHLVSAALRKQTQLERMVFVELNVPDSSIDPINGGWPAYVIDQIRLLEGQSSSVTLPPAFIIASNFSEQKQLERMPQGLGAILEGFKTKHYRHGVKVLLQDAIEEREKNPEIESLWRSLQEHDEVPTTFDGSLPMVDESQRLLIGRAYELPDGEVGVLESATVIEPENKAAGVLRMTSGVRSIVYFDLTNAELAAWKRHPETFFGEFHPYHPPVQGAMDLYEFMLQGYAQSTKEKLLEFMAEQVDIESLRQLSQAELVKQYALRMTDSMLRQKGLPETPVWLLRLRSPVNLT